MLLGVDVGGTFTDAVAFDGAELHTAKAPTTPGDQSQGVVTAVKAALASAGAGAVDVESFAHGMTVGTNALLTQSGARTALIATQGFADLLAIGRQNRPRLYHPCEPRPAPLAFAAFEAAERVGPDGVIEALGEGEAERLADAIRGTGAEAVAVCLLFSYVEAAHERAIADHLRGSLPGVHVSVSHEVLPQFREYERCSTTVVDAYLAPLLAAYLDRLGESAARLGLPAPELMRSSGGLASIDEARQSGAWSVLSGPAGGAVGAARLALLAGERRAIGLDMGGTSCDVCVIDEGKVQRTSAREIEGRPIQLPMVDVHTVGAGGGSIGWVDHGGALRVGPRSAGAEPGPACYGRGGTEPTVTDANLALGYLDAETPLAGGVRLDAEAAIDALGALGEQAGLDGLATAEGIVRVANQEMARAVRVVTVERGIDPREFALLPFGGAGPMHAAALADELGIQRLLCPRASGVLSALGLVASERRRDTARTVMLRGEELSAERLAQEIAALRRSIGADLEDAVAELEFDMRYVGQAFELTVPGDEEPDPRELIERFEALHERLYGHRDADAPVELVNLRLALILPGPEVTPRAAAAAGVREASRRARFESGWHETRVVRGEPEAGFEAAGPCVFELPEATLVLAPGWQARVDPHGTVIAEAVR
jgi:N-methylhydantoinase A